MKSSRQRGAKQLSDERILGSGDFVERIMKEAEARWQRHEVARARNTKVERWIAEVCKKRQVSITELRSGSRRGKMPEVRAEVARRLVEGHGHLKGARPKSQSLVGVVLGESRYCQFEARHEIGLWDVLLRPVFSRWT